MLCSESAKKSASDCSEGDRNTRSDGGGGTNRRPPLALPGLACDDDGDDGDEEGDEEEDPARLFDCDDDEVLLGRGAP